MPSFRGAAAAANPESKRPRGLHRRLGSGFARRRAPRNDGAEFEFTALLRPRGRLDPHLLGDRRDDGALLVDRGGEFRRPAGADDLAGGQQARGDRGVGGGRLDVGGDAVAEVGGEIAGPEQADQAVVFQRGIAGFDDGRDVRLGREPGWCC